MTREQVIATFALMYENRMLRLEKALQTHNWGLVAQECAFCRTVVELLRSSSPAQSEQTTPAGDGSGEQGTGGPAQSAAQNAGDPAAVEGKSE